MGCGCDPVTPFWVPLVSGEVDGGDLFLGDFDLGRVDGRVQAGVDLQAGAGGGRADQVDDHLVAGQRPAAPVEADEAEQPVLDFVPFRGPGREVAEFELEAGESRRGSLTPRRSQNPA